MESILLKYSDFFENDGGFEAIKRDFAKLGDDLVGEAADIKKRVKDQLDLGDIEGLEKTEKQTEELLKTFKKYGEAREDLAEIESEYLKQLKKTRTAEDTRIERLTELDKRLQEQKTNLRELNKLGTINGKVIDDVNKVRQETTINIKATNKEINKLQKEVIESNDLSKKEQKLLKAKLLLDNQEVKSLDDIRERLAALRLVRNQVNIQTEEGVAQVKAFNEEIDTLTEVLSDNNDKFIQGKINIGNYEESIVNALKSQQAFTTGVGGLDAALTSVLGLLLLNKEALDELEKSNKANTNAIKRFAIAFGRLNKVLKASIIGVVVLAVAALSSAFGNTRAGAVRLEKVMKTLSTVISGIGRVAAEIFTSIGNGIAGLVRGFRIFALEAKISFDSLTSFSDEAVAALDENRRKLAELKEEQRLANEETANQEGLWTRIGKIIDDVQKATVQGLANIDRAFKIEDRVRRLNQEIERLNGTLALTQSLADDSTKSLASQLLANQRALELGEQIGERQLEIARSQLEIANERVKQNILANTVEVDNINLGLQGEAFAKATLDLAEARGVQLELSNDLLDEQQQALIEVIKAENELNLTREENDKRRREIERDLFEQNLDLLIDLIDTEKNLSEQVVNNAAVNFQRRVNEFNRFLLVFRQNALRELQQFTRIAQANNLDLEFDIQFNDDGSFSVFINDQELAIDNIVELNKQLQELGIDEITINRFREFIVEARNGVRDFRDLNKELVLVGINVRQLRDNLDVSQDELNALESLQQKITELTQASRGNISEAERKRILKQIEELEKQKTEIARFADEQRLRNRADAIKRELETVEEGSQRELELRQELADIDKKLLEDSIDRQLESTKKANEEQLKSFEKLRDSLNQLTQLILQRLDEVNQKRIDQAEDQRDKQADIVDKQEERARLGLENTLAFEQKALADRERDLIKQQKRQERLEKIKGLYTAYSNYSQRGEEDPIGATLRDFAILEAIAATFGEGGAAEDVLSKVPTDGRGITRGRSHQGRMGGIPVMIEGREGFFSAREMANLGKDNFYKIKSLAGTGPLATNFFSGQKDALMQYVPVGGYDPGLASEIRDVKKAIDRKPVSSLDVEALTNGILKVTEKQVSKNKVVKNTYIIRKRQI